MHWTGLVSVGLPYALLVTRAPCSTCAHPHDSVKVLRCQLPRKNAFYPHDGAAGGEVVHSKEVVLCDLCGQRGDKVCSGCKAVSYCSRAHQREGWKAGHRRACKGRR